ncbi:MAG: flagellar hook-basal body complex protein [Deferribacteres bacterium]|nr:flagellar hook-basal body complex protein [candidate division KSB1 bacterium]MCB9501930.1 flagellar hook-basal body complex protein [Deferribacteres bacterium]
MMRSLFAGVSGLRNHQSRMDVIGNNIANVNTVGFKSGRVNFKEVMALTLTGAVRPSETNGGANPRQIGLGMTVSSIDTIFSQGNLESTGKSTDLAINGEGFFIMRNGKSDYYTRAGNFDFDALGRLVDPSNGWIVQGRMADGHGEIPSSSVVEDIVLPFGQKVPANATSEIQFTGNLDATSVPIGTILDSSVLQAIEEAGDDTSIDGLYAKGQANSRISGMISGRTTFTVNDGSTTQVYTWVNNDPAVGDTLFSSLDDLVAEINNDFAGSMTATLDAAGAVVFTDTSGSAHKLTFQSTNPTLQTAFNSASGVTIDSVAGVTATSDQFSHFASGTEELVKLRNSIGDSLGLTNGDSIDISANVGGLPTTGALAVTNATTLEDLTAQLVTTFGIQTLPGVSIDSDGSIYVQGDPGMDNAIDAVVIRSTGNPTFNTSMSFTTEQEAEDVTHSASTTIFDALGEEHIVSLEFKKTSLRNQWTWTASVGGNEIVSSGNSGVVTFNADGSLNTFTFDNGLNTLSIDPNNGANILDIELNVGTLDAFEGLTQFASASTALASGQNGYGNGDLNNISIDRTGKITGSFTNGVTQTLARLVMATFNNPSGLERVGDNAYNTTGNSGDPIVGMAGESIRSEIVPGSLEMSNVDLAQEFTNMIIAQRGFQANSRVITTSDEMLTELVNLKR